MYPQIADTIIDGYYGGCGGFVKCSNYCSYKYVSMLFAKRINLCQTISRYL